MCLWFEPAVLLYFCISVCSLQSYMARPYGNINLYHDMTIAIILDCGYLKNFCEDKTKAKTWQTGVSIRAQEV